MRMHWVPSTMMKGVGYDPMAMILEIQFRTGDRYRYAGVPPTVYEGLRHPPDKSPGRYFKSHIENVYPFERAE